MSPLVAFALGALDAAAILCAIYALARWNADAPARRAYREWKLDQKHKAETLTQREWASQRLKESIADLRIANGNDQ